MKKYLLLGLIILSINLSAQQNKPLLHCGTDEMRQNLFDTRPDLHQGIINAYNKLDDFTKKYVARNLNNNTNQRAAPYIIPVVFHVIHNNGVENISDEQIYNAIEVLNRNYRKQNADTTDIVNAFKSIAADCEIELRLARKDPNGNCTKGINRIASSLTNIGDHSVKSLIHWDPTKYLNVYVCAEAAGLAGHALLPADADTVPEWDGIVIQHSYVGNIGTSNQLRSVVLSHELGHYLNLQHIWGGNNVPGFFYLPVGQQTNCNFDDDVQDTPNTIGWSTCNLNSFSCGNVQDNVQNFMDYAYCARMFTNGQKLRMHACLNSSVANRNNLWSPSNLIATGTDGSATLCQADFQASSTSVCEGETITFTDKSYHGATGRTWTFQGGTPSTSTDSTVTVTYNNAGTYNVTLAATNGNNTVTNNAISYITILPTGTTTAPYYESFETYSSLANSTWYITNPDQDQTFELTDNATYTGSFSAMLNNFSATPNRVDELTSGTYSLNLPVSTTIEFKYAFAFKTGTAGNDRLRFFISSDCGATWTQRRSLTGTQLSTATATDLPFYPQSTSEWKTVSITGINNAFMNDKLRVKFVFEGDGGNNLFIEDINIANAVYTGIDEVFNLLNEAEIYPNPFSHNVSIKLQNENQQQVTCKIFDVVGNIITTEKIIGKEHHINTQHFSRGVYIVLLEANGLIIRKKIIKQ